MPGRQLVGLPLVAMLEQVRLDGPLFRAHLVREHPKTRTSDSERRKQLADASLLGGRRVDLCRRSRQTHRPQRAERQLLAELLSSGAAERC